MKIILKSGNLFSATTHLAHCISEDCNMGKGIALQFKRLFGGITELNRQRVKTGGLAVLQRDNRYIYCLVTKKYYYSLPTYENLEKSLECLRHHCITNNVESLAIPKIGCGLDRLAWSRVYEIISNVFQGTDIDISVYVL